MGLDIADIVAAEPRELADFRGRAVAIDAYNALYQFLSSIRQPDGTQLMSPEGKVTSHLAGLIYRNSSLLEVGVRPVYVFDGKPHPLKSSTISERRSRREAAEVEWREALEAGDMEKARTKAQQSTRLTGDMVQESADLLGLLGIPCIMAPGEGEAQASHMAARGDVWAAASQDYDSILFGSPRLIRNMTLSGRRKVPRRDIYVTIRPEMIEAERALAQLGMTREQLVDLGILMGTDFNEGVRGIGPKKGMKLVKELGDAKAVMAAKGYDIPSIDAVREIFLKPNVTDAYELKWKSPDVAGIVAFLCDRRGFSHQRIEATVGKIAAAKSASAQKSIDAWF
ncbi:MAG: flap endonuclease-1 [Euryarchaeota archaeon]|nr:flap endonuclease-1 [Euryarchaeota archaeon]